MVQIDIPIPTECSNCLFYSGDNKCGYCDITQESIRVPLEKSNNCPLIEIKGE